MCVRVRLRVRVRVCECVRASERASERACARVDVSFYSIIFGILPGRVCRYSVVSFMHYAHSI